ncbi:ATP citrate lyase citrate-binding domain-containing protein [Candidatus Lokiarchaeum ossiferum]|uniref:ATP citrate lyase citrate-binding domain-containing protein n=1 Tax=Candidatus Lokiarchaeum ossiferum TaxID=2951803 RepID=UPI00352F309E
MAQKPIYEYDGKKLLASQIPKYFPEFKFHNKLAVLTPETDIDKLAEELPWLKTDKLVAKPDQLFGKRGKANLLLLDANLDQLKAFAAEKLDKVFEISGKKGKLTRLLVEPFVPHEKEYYVSITSDRDYDIIHFSLEGGIFVEENWDKVTHIKVPFTADLATFDFKGQLPDLGDFGDVVVPFVRALLHVYQDQDFAFLEINPFAITAEKEIVPLDLKSRLDNTAYFLHNDTWNTPDAPVEFPGGFGMELTESEQFIDSLDAKTGASLKFNLLNPDGHIWTLLSGGGASVIFTDTIADLGFGMELSNYGEYSGNPSLEHTQLYAETVIDLMTKNPDPAGKPKYLFIAGGIANFTNVKATFSGIVKAFRKKVDQLKKANVKIYVRRGGPYEKEGLQMMKEIGTELGLDIEVHDRYTPLTRIVPLALKGGN